MANNRQALVAVYASVALCVALVSVVAFVANWRLAPQPDPAYEGVAAQPRVFHWFYGYHLQRWDAGWYREIAQHGYQDQAVSFFPLYPVFVRLVQATGLGFPVASSLVSLAATLVAVYYLYRLADLELGGSEVARQAVQWLLIFPTSFFLFAPYTESLFLAFLGASLYHLRRQQYLVAGLAAYLLALTRVTGVLVVILVLGELWRHWHERGARLKLGAVLAAPLAGLGTYATYLAVRFGDAFAFLHQQANWDRFGGVGLAAFLERWGRYLGEYRLVYSPENLAPLVSRGLDVMFLLGGLAMAVAVFVRWRRDWGLWMLAMVMLPLLSGTLLGMPRFVLPLPFTYLFLARQVSSDTVRWMVTTLSTAAWALLLALFSSGYWVA